MKSIYPSNTGDTKMRWFARIGCASGHAHGRLLPYLLVLALLIVLIPIAAQARDAAFYACISSDQWTEAKVLGPVPALPLGSARLEFQTHQSCVNYCLRGALPPGMGKPRGFEQLRPPYKYAIYGNGGWCFCGNEVKGAAVECSLCLGKMNCLVGNNYTKKCYINTERNHMVFELNPTSDVNRCPVGAAGGTQQTGTAAGTQQAGSTVAPQPTGATGNRRPYPPTVQPGGYEPPFPIEYEGAYQMSWRNNGDPDGDVLTFGVIIWQYDWTGRRWVQVPTIRDQYGTYGMTWQKEDNFTFTTAKGLSPRTHYAWMVWACDLDKGASSLCSWSGWQVFRTQ